MTAPSTPFPPGRQYALTWGLDRDFGGMTAVMLARSQAFAEVTGAPVEILTFDARDDYDRLLEYLRADRRIAAGIGFRNLWDDLTDPIELSPPPREAKAAALAGFAPMPAAGRTAIRHAADGTVLQIDRRRADGTLAVSDRRDTKIPGTPGGRSIVVCDAAGEPVFGFSRARPFYHWWLDTVLGDHDSFLLVDSKTAAGILVDYASRRATRIHVLHNSHLEGETRPWGRLKASRLDVLPRLDDFDAVVVLTERQRDDIALLLGASDVMEVVPNPVALPAAPATGPREARRGVLVGSLIERKRVEHALRAVALAREAGAELGLDVYGDGPLRGELEMLAAELGLSDAVRFHGFRPDALEEFGRASFFLLTSRTEGFPLVLAEGMSRGCIPVSYDIPYGPADIIEDGRSGYLIPPGDVPALARRLAELSRGVPDGMRQAAAARASRFSDDEVLRRWSEVLRRARDRRVRDAPSFTVQVLSSEVRRRGGSFTASADFRLKGVDVSPAQVSAAVTLRGPDRIVLRATGSLRRTLRHGVWRTAVRFPTGAADWLPAGMTLTGELELRIERGVTRVALSPEQGH